MKGLTYRTALAAGLLVGSIVGVAWQATRADPSSVTLVVLMVLGSAAGWWLCDERERRAIERQVRELHRDIERLERGVLPGAEAARHRRSP